MTTTGLCFRYNLITQTRVLFELADTTWRKCMKDNNVNKNYLFSVIQCYMA